MCLLRHRDAAVQAAQILRDKRARHGARRVAVCSVAVATGHRDPRAAVRRSIQHVARHALQGTVKVVRDVQDVLAETLNDRSCQIRSDPHRRTFEEDYDTCAAQRAVINTALVSNQPERTTRLPTHAPRSLDELISGCSIPP